MTHLFPLNVVCTQDNDINVVATRNNDIVNFVTTRDNDNGADGEEALQLIAERIA